MKAGCCAGCPPAVSLDEAGWQSTLQQFASPKPQCLIAHPKTHARVHVGINQGSDVHYREGR